MTWRRVHFSDRHLRKILKRPCRRYRLFHCFPLLTPFFSIYPLKWPTFRRYLAAIRSHMRYTLDFDARPTSLPSPYRFQTAIQDRKQ
jgi:hypothetical protein